MLADGEVAPENLGLLVRTDDPAVVEHIVVDCCQGQCAEVPKRSEAPN